ASAQLPYFLRAKIPRSIAPPSPASLPLRMCPPVRRKLRRDSVRILHSAVDRCRPARSICLILQSSAGRWRRTFLHRPLSFLVPVLSDYFVAKVIPRRHENPG